MASDDSDSMIDKIAARVVIVAAVIGAVSAISYFFNDGGSGRARPPASAKVNPSAVEPWTADDYPKTYARLGPEAFARANRLLEGAAMVAASHPSCDRVWYVGVSDLSTPTSIEFFVDCENGQRFRPSEVEAALASRR